MTPRQILVVVAFAFVVAGVVLGNRSHDVGDAFSTVSCGSVFSPSKQAGNIEDAIGGSDFNGDCDSEISDAKPLTYGAIGLGAIALIAAFVASNDRPSKPESE